MIRSFLYVPGSSERFIAKAHERGADAIILDLEDSVLPSEKAGARERLPKSVALVGQRGAKVFVRVNSEEARLPLDVSAACRAGAFGIILPKTRDAAMIIRVAAVLDAVERETGRTSKAVILALIEDANALFEARAIAAASPRVFGLACGGEDLPTLIGAEPTPEFLRFPKLMVHFAAKAAGVRSFGLLRTVADFRDLDAVAQAIDEARSFGFDGSTCIHPSLVPLLNEGFSPSPEQVAKAQRLLAASEEAKRQGLGAFIFEGKMADEPVVQRARSLLARYEQFQGRPKP
jgi:citrate lyase subunit beta/citryl-CoA lyase